MQKIAPCLLFDGKAEEAAEFYVSIFKDSKMLNVMRRPDGPAVAVTFQLEGQEFVALNGSAAPPSPAISLLVKCQTQGEVDELWERLSAGGETQRCAWLKDRYGVSWQIVPTVLGQLLQDKDPEKAGRVMNAMLQMDKIDIAALKKAYA